MPHRSQHFSHELLALLHQHVSTTEPIQTLRIARPNWVSAIESDAICVETEKSRAAGKEPLPVPAWMFEVAWQRLTDRGRLTYQELVDTDDLNVKRSSLVCAALARLPGVVVTSSDPIVLAYRP